VFFEKLIRLLNQGVKKFSRFTGGRKKDPILTNFNLAHNIALPFGPKSFSILSPRNYILVTPSGRFHWNLPEKFSEDF
jgi:hypothetical protein